MQVANLDETHGRVDFEHCRLHLRHRGSVRQLQRVRVCGGPDCLASRANSDNHLVVAQRGRHVRVVQKGVFAEAHVLLVPPWGLEESILRAAEWQIHVRHLREAAVGKETPVTIAMAPQLGQHHDAINGGGEAEQVTNGLPLRRVHEHVPLRRPLGEALVDRCLVLGGVRGAVERNEDALGEVRRRIDRPQRRLARALPLAVRVLLRVAELEGEVDGDGLELRLLVPFHLLHVLVEPRVAAREGADG
mmetsp:Transcript_54409/g.125355  ORF Transcript_54409/g.125355 Transcript_54409/m.125355 type:complete len:247 (+) Transcript_54409:856-1596(+)